jgi:serine/threonine-protein kinase
MASIHIGRLLGPVGFSRTVAIKRLHEQFARDPEFVAMFLDEARIAARVRHPNVVPTLDVVAMDNEIFLVMDFIQGESLSFFLKRLRREGTRVPMGIGVHIVIEVLQGLHAAHEARNEQGEPLGLVHRDISPQNVLVGADGVARVVDFGIAKAIGRMHQTRTGQIKGKIQYMAPEQLTGKNVSRSADIYAASVVLWETLTGERLFTNDNDVEVMYQIMEGAIAAPSSLVPGLPPVLDAIVLRGLHKDPNQRYATAREMALALDAAVPAVSTNAVAEWVLSQAAESMTRRSSQIARIESDSPLEPSRDSLVSQPSIPTSSGMQEQPLRGSVLPETPVTSPTHASAFTDIPGVPGPSKGRVFVGAAAGLALGLGVTLVLLQQRAPAAAESTLPPHTSASAPLPLPASSAATAAVAAAVASSSAAPAASQAPTASATATSEHRSPDRNSSRSPTSAPTKAPPAAPTSPKLYQRD